MKIALDGFGGDNSPDEVIKGAVAAVSEYGAEILLTGNETALKNRIRELGVSVKGITIVNADGIITTADNPADIRKEKINTSMGKALQLAKNGQADAAVSAGSTAALVIGGTMITGRIKGVKRAALAVLMPGLDGFYMLLDGGANIECRPEILCQFAVMGSIFMNKVMNVQNPRVGLLNVGTEKEKGREIELETFRLLSDSPVNFIGNIEGRDPTLNKCDVVVTDGFTGNIFLKSIEGMGKFIKESMKRIFKANLVSMAGYLAVKKGVKEFAGKMDYKEVGGSPLLGAAKPIIKAHGSSDARAFKNAIRQAVYFTERGVINEIAAALAENQQVNRN